MWDNRCTGGGNLGFKVALTSPSIFLANLIREQRRDGGDPGLTGDADPDLRAVSSLRLQASPWLSMIELQILCLGACFESYWLSRFTEFSRIIWSLQRVETESVYEDGLPTACVGLDQLQEKLLADFNRCWILSKGVWIGRASAVSLQKNISILILLCGSQWKLDM